ncbi:hypothetical protein [Haloarcula sp. CBA1129]|uniref:hypothetical protein n=1 Tax=Haloarcula sp. CBA1129 TaxID=1853684 RepID=UPI0012447541|nr:hypothetical protein [Haloarcula sp. CBA1129]KAA9399681.1 hypothetical protein Har1129_16230 [Haloarcula sp. CBA1129]
MAGLSASSGSGFDYIQAAEPADPENAELWFDTDGGPDGQGEAKVYDGSEWQATGYISHDQLTNVAPADHHDPVTVSTPLTRSGQALALAFGNALTLDGNDDLAVDESAISHDNISAVSDADHHDPVTVSAPLTRSGQALAVAYGNALTLDGNDDLAVDESAISLSNLSGYPVGMGDLGFDTATQNELNSHAGDTTNPHNVTDDQTGAADALSNHASDATVHHSKPSGTNSASKTSGRTDGLRLPILEPWNGADMGSNLWTPLNGVYSEIKLDNDYSQSQDIDLYYHDGTVVTESIPGNSAVWVSVSQKPLAGAGLSNSNTTVVGVNQLTAGGHSHSI